MTLLGMIELMKSIKRWLVRKINHKDNTTMFKVKNLILEPNPRNPEWGKRPLSYIDKIIVHQELGNNGTIAVHKYHTSKKSHLKPGVGAPKIAYHFTIEKDGTVYRVNELNDITWHCAGQNMKSIGIMLVGNFDGPTYTGKGEPTSIQLQNLSLLLDYLRLRLPKIKRTDVYGHCDFGKQNCPGNKVMGEILTYRGKA